MAQVFAARCQDLFGRAPWLDETITSLIVNDKSFSHMVSAISTGVDTNPPTFYLILWPIARMFGPLSDTALRAIALASMLAAVTGVYGICRLFFGRLPSAVAALAVWAHPLIVEHAFQARCYAPWLAVTVWFCYLQIQARDDEPAARRIARYILAIFATTMHYFGFIAMVLIGAADFLVHRRVRRIVPVAVGIAALVACVPLVIKQRAGLSVGSWIDPFSAAQFKDDLVALFGSPSLIVVLLLIWIGHLTQSAPGADGNKAHNARDYRELIPLSSLFLLPFVIAAFSLLIQPALVLRYMILSIAPLAPPVALLAQRSSKRIVMTALVVLAMMGIVTVVGVSHTTRGLDAEFRAAAAEIDRRVPSDGLIIFKRRREMYPVLHLRPDLAARSAQLDFDDSVLPVVTGMSRYERDMGRKVQRIYPSLRMADRQQLIAAGTFYVIAPVNEFKELQRQLPGFRVDNPDSVLHTVTVQR
ncbi:MAG TPA: glycosyltransferase family 39 protein [Tepidisphaeraceae bacterium]